MRTVGRRLAVFCIAMLMLVGAPVHAETVSVTIGVGDTILTVSGQTSPDAFVTISKNGSVIGTTSADGDGAYTQTFPAQEPGIQQLSVFANAGGQNTDTVSLNVNIAEHATTTVNIFLPPTITIDDTSLEQDQQLVLSGVSAPSSTITIYIDDSHFAMASTDTEGLWNASIETTSLASGQHTLFVRATDGLGEQSYPTASRTFSVAAQPDLPPPATAAPEVPVITFPQTGAVWREANIRVEGTADDEVQIELWDGDSLLGSVFSDGRGNWSMTLQLQQKVYELRARACLDQKCSAFSPTVRFGYEPETSIAPNEQPLTITVPRASFTVYQHQTVTLRAIVVDGQPPYKVNIAWGDGKTETHNYTQGDLRFSHVYDEPGNYTVKVDVEDSQGRKNSVNFTVEVELVGSGFSFVVPIALSFIFVLSFSWLAIFGYRRLFIKVPRIK